MCRYFGTPFDLPKIQFQSNVTPQLKYLELPLSANTLNSVMIITGAAI